MTIDARPLTAMTQEARYEYVLMSPRILRELFGVHESCVCYM
jgi:hypothetical protein